MSLRWRLRGWTAIALLLSLALLAAAGDLLISSLAAQVDQLGAATGADLAPLRGPFRLARGVLWLAAAAVALPGVALAWAALQGLVVAPLAQAARALGGDPQVQARRELDELARLSAALDDYRRALGQEQASRASQFEALQSLRGAADVAVEQLQQADRLALVGRVAMGVAHEIGSPLAIVSGYLERLTALERQGAPLEERQRCIDHASHACERIHALLSDFAAPGLPRARPADRPCDLAAVALRVIGQCEQHPRARQLHIELRCGAGQHPADASASHIEQVLTNLVVNAADALRKQPPPGGGRVELALARQGDWQVLSVDDDGPGIDAAAFERVFDEFYSTKATPGDASRGSGWGLGLAVSRRIATSYGGTLTAGSSPLGGARMTLRLPVAAGQRQAARPTGPIDG